MSELNFTKLGAVEALDEVPENANALVEVDGAIKRVPGSGLGGSGGGVPMAVITYADGKYTCDNMSCEEAEALFDAQKPFLIAIYHISGNDYGSILYYSTDVIKESIGLLTIKYEGNENGLWWTSDGINERIQI